MTQDLSERAVCEKEIESRLYQKQFIYLFLKGCLLKRCF